MSCGGVSCMPAYNNSCHRSRSGSGQEYGRCSRGLTPLEALHLGVVNGADVGCVRQTLPEMLRSKPCDVYVLYPGACLVGLNEPLVIDIYEACTDCKDSHRFENCGRVSYSNCNLN